MREAEAAFESLLCNPSASHVSFEMNSRITICLLQFDFEDFFFGYPAQLVDLSSLTRDRSWGPAVKALSPHHWTAGEVPGSFYH